MPRPTQTTIASVAIEGALAAIAAGPDHADMIRDAP